MAKKLTINMVDGKSKQLTRSFGLTDAATVAQAGSIVTAYARLTDAGVVGAKITDGESYTATGFTSTAADAGARYWNTGRISVPLDTIADGGQTEATIDVPGFKAAYNSSGLIVDADTDTSGTGDIQELLTLFLAAGNGRTSDGQSVSDATAISGYIFEREHPATEN